MVKRCILILAVCLLFVTQLGHVAVAADERKSQERDESAYELMTYADDSWYDVSGQAGSAVAKSVKNFFWSINMAMAQLVFMIVYQLFSLDIVEMTKENVAHIVSGTAGALVRNLGLFALAVAGVGIVLRAYVNQNWQAFFKLLVLVIFSMSLLFSMQAKKLNYIDFAHDLSVSLENTLMRVNPSLTGSDEFYFNDFNDNTARHLSISIENKVFDALVYKPYLLLQYGTTNEDKITEDDPHRITRYLDADPTTEEGIKEREEIAKEEYSYDGYNNKHIFAGNAWKQSGYILVMILSTVVQGVVFFAIALLRIMLQFGFILMLLIAPIIVFLSMFPTFESLVGRYLKGAFLLILFKALTVFVVLIAVSFISLGYDLTNASDDIYYRIFTQIIFSVATIFVYSKRQFLLNMLEGATPSLEDMGGGRLPRPSRAKVLPLNRGVRPTGGRKRSAFRNPMVAAAHKQAAKAGTAAGKKLKNAKKQAGSKFRDARAYMAAVQKGEVPGMENPYHSALHAEKETAAAQTVSEERVPPKPKPTGSAASAAPLVGGEPSGPRRERKVSSARNPRHYHRHAGSTSQRNVSAQQPTPKRRAVLKSANQSLRKKMTTVSRSTVSKLRSAKAYMAQVQKGEFPTYENPYKSSVWKEKEAKSISRPTRLQAKGTSSPYRSPRR